jgi:hypothetical protein
MGGIHMPDEHDPWEGYEEPADQRAASHCAAALAPRERAWRLKLPNAPLAVADAVLLCEFYGQPPPPWVAAAVIEMASKTMPQIDVKRHREDMKHWVRWEAVKELRERKDQLYADFGDERGTAWDRVWPAVSELFEKTPANGSPPTIKASYLYVETELKEGRGARFLFVDRRIDPDNDPRVLTAKKHRPG